MDFLVEGLVIGLAIAAPVGPIGVLCIRRTLADGRLIGFLSGLGAATADMTYGAIAAFGLTSIQSFLVQQQSWLHLVGGLFLIYLGVRTFVTRPTRQAALDAAPRSWPAAYFSTLGLTLSNPATIISFMVIFAGLRLGDANGNYASAALLVGGVFLGSSLWWFTLSGMVGFFRERFTIQWMTWVNRSAGIVILVFGLLALFLT